MAYKNRFGITQIRSQKRNNLSINWDYDTKPNDIKDRFAVLLYTPDMDNTDEHFHIELGLKHCKILHEWLGEFIKEKEEATKDE